MKPTIVAPTKPEAPLPEVDVVKKPPTDFVVPMATVPTVKQTPKPKWSWCHMGWSTFSFIFCFPVCGLMGMVYSILSYVDHKSADYSRSAKKRRHAWGWTIASIVVGLIVWGLMIACAVKYYHMMHYAARQQVTDNFYPEPAHSKGWNNKDLWEKMEHRMKELENVKQPELPMMFGGDDHDKMKHGSKMTDEERRRHHDRHHGDRDHDSDSDGDHDN